MNDKIKVVRKLLGKCECTSMEEGCFAKCSNDMRCSRDIGHKGKHFACGQTHRIYEWCD